MIFISYRDAGALEYSCYFTDAVYNPVVATCTPFTYNRGSPCSDNLAASTFPARSSMDLTTELDFCELQSNDDLVYLESVARILGSKTVRAKFVTHNKQHHPR